MPPKALRPRSNALLFALVGMLLATRSGAQVELFPGPVFIESPGGPESVAVVDFNGDTRLDLVATGTIDGTIGIHEGAGNLNFLTPRVLAVGGSPIRIRATDLDRDDKTDLIWLDEASGALHWAYGTHIPAIPLDRLGSHPEEDETAFIDLVDLGSDGWMDVVLAMKGADKLVLHRNDGAGTLLPPEDYDAGDLPTLVRAVYWPTSIDPHFLVVQRGALSRDIGVYTGASPSLQQLLPVSNPLWLDIGNWNGDTYPDAITLNRNGEQGIVFFGQADGTLSYDREWGLARGSTAIAWVDNIGDLRRVAASEAPRARVALYEGLVDGTGMVFKGGYYVGRGLGEVTAVELDGNAGDELVVSLFDEDLLAVVPRFGAGYRAYRSVLTSSIPSSMDWIDPSPDHLGKSAVLGAGTPQVEVFTSNGSVLERTATINTGFGVSQLRWGYLDADGQPDLALLRNGVGIDIHLAQLGGFGPAIRVPVVNTVNSLALGDVNDDGHCDLVLAESDFRLSVYHGDSSGSFSFSSTVNTAIPPRFVKIHDMDRDDRGDLLMLDGTFFVYLFFSESDGSFSSPSRLSSGMEPQDISIGNLNNDAFPDFVVSNRGGGEGGSFTAFGSVFARVYDTTTFEEPVPTGAERLEIVDANDDGTADVAVVSPSTPELSVHLGSGGGLFIPPLTYRVASLPLEIAVGLVDGDNLPDIMVMDGLSEAVTIVFQAASTPLELARYHLEAKWGAGGVTLRAEAPSDARVRRERDGRWIPLLRERDGVYSGLDRAPYDGESYALIDASGATQARAAAKSPLRVTSSVQLAPPFPNPSTGPVQLRFKAPGGTAVRLRIIDPAGRVVRDLPVGPGNGGWFAAQWDGRDGRGGRVARGRYLVELRAGTRRVSAAVVRLGP